jgi:prepilin-type processing-associated H-X9-DG protein
MKPLKIRGTMGLVAALALLFAAIGYQVREGRGHREAARRAQCVNNLKLLGLAILEYESRTGAFPTGTVANSDLPLDRRLGWNYLIAPNLEIRPPFAEGELNLAIDDPALRSLRSDVAFTELCPTLQNKKIANYVGIAGLGLDSPALPKNDRRAGVFGDDRVVTLADLFDGSPNTMMVADSSAPAGPWLAGGRNTVRGLDPARQPYIGNGRQFGGIHGEGANVLLADGSVKFVKHTVAPKVFEAMSTIAGGERVSLPWEN